jgi:hypothetical protein
MLPIRNRRVNLGLRTNPPPLHHPLSPLATLTCHPKKTEKKKEKKPWAKKELTLRITETFYACSSYACAITRGDVVVPELFFFNKKMFFRVFFSQAATFELGIGKRYSTLCLLKKK